MQMKQLGLLAACLLATSFTACTKASEGRDNSLVSVRIFAGDSGPMHTRTSTAAEVDAKLDKAFSGTATLKPFLPGTIPFELPAGEGTIEIDCQTMPGYTLNIRIAEYGTAYITSTIEQALRGKATVNYSVTQNTYVVIYLEGAPAGSAPARIARTAAEENAGAYIWSITVIPNKTPTGIDTTDIHQSANAKFVKDGILYIRHNGRIYTVIGEEVK